MTEPCDGATNMAIDEAVWRARQAGVAMPTLRFFAWEPPTVSLGYGQSLDRHVSVDACRALGVGLVRRPTGGSAIYHDGPERELTYSVIASTEDLGGVVDLLATYHWIARALCRGLRALGAQTEIVAAPNGDGPTPAFCFARTGRYEIEIGHRKVVGSAQRRQGNVFLKHGSVILAIDVPRIREVFPTIVDPLATMTTLESALGRRPSWQECADALAAAFESEHGITLQPGALARDEIDEVERLVVVRYGTDKWLAGAA